MDAVSRVRSTRGLTDFREFPKGITAQLLRPAQAEPLIRLCLSVNMLHVNVLLPVSGTFTGLPLQAVSSGLCLHKLPVVSECKMLVFLH